LNDRKGQYRQQPDHHHEFGDSGSRLVCMPAPGGRAQCTDQTDQKLVTRLMACSKTPLSAGPASAQIMITSPAVMSVIKTQPGTSPRSSRSHWAPNNRRRIDRPIAVILDMNSYFLQMFPG
jgi:hypothetical protein